MTEKRTYLATYRMHPMNDVGERVITVYETDAEDGIDKVVTTLEADPNVKEILDIVSAAALDVMKGADNDGA